MDRTGGREVAFRRKVRTLPICEAAHDLGDHEVGIGIALPVPVRAHVDGHAVDADREVRAVVDIEAADEILVGFAFAAVLRDDEARHRLEHFAGAIDRRARKLFRADEPLACRLRDADVASARVEGVDGGEIGHAVCRQRSFRRRFFLLRDGGRAGCFRLRRRNDDRGEFCGLLSVCCVD
jgi:hypothetical protein